MGADRGNDVEWRVCNPTKRQKRGVDNPCGGATPTGMDRSDNPGPTIAHEEGHAVRGSDAAGQAVRRRNHHIPVLRSDCDRILISS